VKLDAYPQYRVEKNPSWFKSAWAGVKIGILWGPSRLLHALTAPTLAFLSSSGLIVLSVLMWVLGTLCLIALGFLGHVVEETPALDQQSGVTDV